MDSAWSAEHSCGPRRRGRRYTSRPIVTHPLDLSPDQFRAASAAIVEILSRHLATISERKVAAVHDPERLRAEYDEPLPRAGKGLDAMLARIAQRVVPGSMAIGSARYFGQFNPAAIPIAALFELVVTVLNQNAGSFLQSPVMTAIEVRVIRWLLDLAGFPAGASGHFTTGGTPATMTALKIARDRAGADVRRRGVGDLAGRARVYASDQAHFSIARGLDVLGLGQEALVKIDSDARFRMRADLLATRIAEDRARGLVPIAVVATAGTTPTGSLDPLAAIADVAARERVFFHVDAAYGGAALLSRALAPRLAGIERADSITIDPHKWMLMPNDAGCILVRDAQWLKDAFDEQPSYLADSADRHAILPDFYRQGLQGSRRARAFRLWATLEVLGSDTIGAALERHVELAKLLEARVRKLAEFEIVSAPDFALVCFRHVARGKSPEQQDEINRRIQRHVEASGEAWFATTVLRGRKTLRVNVESFRTTEADIDRLLAAIERAAREVSG